MGASERTDPFVEPIGAFPAVGRAFAAERRAELADCDPSGRARLDSIARWLQDVAYADVVDAGIAGEGLWIARRVRLRVEGFPRFGEPLRMRTACSALGRLVAERRTTLESPAGRVEAVALWVFLDAETRLPARLDENFASIYAPSAEGRRARSGLRHPAEPAEGALAREWFFRRADLDLAGHVNNAAYWEIAEELVGDQPVSSLDAEVEYRDGIGAGVAQVRVAGGSVWVLDAGGGIAATLEIALGS